MPQMMPMFWTCILASCMLSLILTISFLYFNPMESLPKSLSPDSQLNLIMIKSNWKWSWL